MKKGFIWACLLCVCLACAGTAHADEREQSVWQFLQRIHEGDASGAYEMLSAETASVWGYRNFGAMVGRLHRRAGMLQKVDAPVRVADAQGDRFIIPMHYEDYSMQAVVTLDASGKVDYASFEPMDASIPSNAQSSGQVWEEEVTFGDAWPISGTLSMPVQMGEKTPAVVLVHGSGRQDRNNAAGDSKTFQDLATGLAQAGFVVLRYDKRTYVYYDRMPANYTLWDETVQDALLAQQLLAELPYVDADRIFLIGHSLGASLLPRIQAYGGAFAGMVMLAGSPRPIVNVYESFFYSNIPSFSTEDQAGYIAWLEMEHVKLKQILSSAPKADANATAFGYSSAYLLDAEQYNTAQLALEAGIPMLILHGAEDAVLPPQQDYLLWRSILFGVPDVFFQLYPGLDHYLTDEDGKMNQQVIADIVLFLEDH